MNMYMIAERLGMRPDMSVLVLTFFAFSFLGNIMECVVLSLENKKLVTNRGFTHHLPFCIIYGAGAIAGFLVLSPFKHSAVLLYVVGAICATVFELVVGNMQLRLFGSFWWDYSHKPFNYKGMICLESTIGWGIVAIVVVRYLHGALVGLLSLIPTRIASVLAMVLVLAYAADFVFCAHQARRVKLQNAERERDGVSGMPILK